MSDHHSPQETLLFMLGEMRADLKYLVNERHKTSARVDALEDDHNKRITRLETFKTRIGALTAVLGVGVPTILTAVAHKMGLF